MTMLVMILCAVFISAITFSVLGWLLVHLLMTLTFIHNPELTYFGYCFVGFAFCALIGSAKLGLNFIFSIKFRR